MFVNIVQELSNTETVWLDKLNSKETEEPPQVKKIIKWLIEDCQKDNQIIQALTLLHDFCFVSFNNIQNDQFYVSR